MKLKFVSVFARASAALLIVIAASRVARIWDSLREGNVMSFELLACTEDKVIERLVRIDLMPAARLEKALRKEVLEF